MYNVDLDDLVAANRINITDSIEIGQRIIIPGRSKPQPQLIKYSESDEFIWPLKGRVISGFGQTYNNMLNKGINIQPYASRDVVAAKGGKVVFCSEDFASLGKTIIIEHSDRISSVYGRNSEVYVKTGDIVSKGAVIAKAGSSGRDKNTYLHFEIRKRANPQNPLFYLS